MPGKRRPSSGRIQIKSLPTYPNIIDMQVAARLAAEAGRKSQLGSPTRWLILGLLIDADQHRMISRDICEAIVSRTDQDPMLILEHLRGLAQAGIVSATRVGRVVIYQLDADKAQQYARELTSSPA